LLKPLPCLRANLGPIVAGDSADVRHVRAVTSCDPARGRRQLIRRLRAVEWEGLLGLPLHWSDPSAEGGTADAAIVRLSWLSDPPESFPEPLRDLAETLQRAGGNGPVPLATQGHVAFEYANTPAIFGAETGYGPLVVALDTNVLIDYAQGAEQIWGGSDDIDPAEWHARAPALRDLMTVWLWRDVRFRVFARQLSDAKRALGAERRRAREAILDAFYTDASERADWGSGDPLPTHARGIRKALPLLPSGADRELVETALADGCHVFLTEDDKILRHNADLAADGLQLLRIRELLDALLASGELEQRRSVCGVVPDNHGMGHLMRGVESPKAARLHALAES
jgi:hypothetical protein